MSFFKRENKRENKLWFMDEIHRPEQDQRIREVFRIREYLLGKHTILMRQRLSILDSLHNRITDDMINMMAVSADLEIKEGEVEDRYMELRNCLRTFEKYECNRLR